MANLTGALRVLVVSPPAGQHGGVATFADLLCATLAQRHRVVRARAGGGSQPGWMPLRLLRDALSIRQQARREAVDVVVLNPSFNKAILRDTLGLLLLRTGYKGSVVVVNHGWGTTMPQTIDRLAPLQAVARWCCASVDRIFVLGESRRRLLLSWGFDPQRVQATTMMYDDNGACPRRNAPGQGSGALRVLMLSRLAPGKGAGELLQAMAAMPALARPIKLIIAGDGPQRDALQRQAASLGLAETVSFPGFVEGEAKARCLAEADVFVLPSHLNEGFPVSLLEAMGAGLPIVASSVGGVVDLFAAGAQGAQLPPRPQPAAIARALWELLADPAGMAAAGEANRQLAQSRFAAPAWCAAFEGVLLQCVQRRAMAGHTAGESP